MIQVMNISSDMNIGGAGRCILNYLKYADGGAFQVSLAVPKGSALGAAARDQGAEVIEVNGLADRSLSAGDIGSLRRLIQEQRPDIVHTHGAMSGRIAAKLSHTPVVYTRHSVFPPGRTISQNPGKWLNGRVNECFSDAIIAVAEAAKENLVQCGVSPGKIQVILNGVERLEPPPPDMLESLKTKYGIPPGAFVLGILARLEPVKGHSYLFEAARALRDEGQNLKVLVAGTGSEETLLKKQCREMGLEDTVIFTGFVENVSEILGLMDLQINASWGTEATSLALLEGMSMGIPAVVSDYGGNPGVITDGVNGLIFPAKNSGALKHAVARLMDSSEEVRALQKGSRRIFDPKFTVQQYARNIEAVYSGLMNKRGI